MPLEGSPALIKFGSSDDPSPSTASLNPLSMPSKQPDQVKATNSHEVPIEGGERLTSLQQACQIGGKGSIGLGMVCNTACTLGGMGLGFILGAKAAALGGLIGFVLGGTLGAIQGASVGRKLAINLALENKLSFYGSTVFFGCVGIILGVFGGAIAGATGGALGGSAIIIAGGVTIGALIGGQVGTFIGMPFSAIGGCFMNLGKADSKEIETWQKTAEAPLTNLSSYLFGPKSYLYNKALRPLLTRIKIFKPILWQFENKQEKQPTPWTHTTTDITQAVRDLTVNTTVGRGSIKLLEEAVRIHQFIQADTGLAPESTEPSPQVEKTTESTLRHLLRNVKELLPKSRVPQLTDNQKTEKQIIEELKFGFCAGTSLALPSREGEEKIDPTKVTLLQILDNLETALPHMIRVLGKKIETMNQTYETIEDDEKAERLKETILNKHETYQKMLKTLEQIEKYKNQIAKAPIEQPADSLNLSATSTLPTKLKSYTKDYVDMRIYDEKRQKGHAILLNFTEGRFELYDRNMGYYKYESREKLIQALEQLLQAKYPDLTQMRIAGTITPLGVSHKLTVIR
jgi:hypothetical protein